MEFFSAAKSGVDSESDFQVEMRVLTDVPPIAQDLSAASLPPALPMSFGRITAVNELLVYQIWLPESPDNFGQLTALKRLVCPPDMVARIAAEPQPARNVHGAWHSEGQVRVVRQVCVVCSGGLPRSVAQLLLGAQHEYTRSIWGQRLAVPPCPI